MRQVLRLARESNSGKDGSGNGKEKIPKGSVALPDRFTGRRFDADSVLVSEKMRS
jgi:hypothetical protein